MSRVILKPDHHVDLYAVYSETSDAVLFVGTRAAVRRWLVAEADRPADRSPVVVGGRLDRADRHGSSSLVPLVTGEGVLYGWADPQLRIAHGPGGPGFMHRNDLLGYCRDLAADDEAAAAARVEPDDDEGERD